MSADENKALVRRYVVEFVDRGNFDLSDEMFTPNFVRYGAGPDQVSGVEDLSLVIILRYSPYSLEGVFSEVRYERTKYHSFGGCTDHPVLLPWVQPLRWKA